MPLLEFSTKQYELLTKVTKNTTKQLIEKHKTCMLSVSIADYNNNDDDDNNNNNNNNNKHTKYS